MKTKLFVFKFSKIHGNRAKHDKRSCKGTIMQISKSFCKFVFI